MTDVQSRNDHEQHDARSTTPYNPSHTTIGCLSTSSRVLGRLHHHGKAFARKLSRVLYPHQLVDIFSVRLCRPELCFQLGIIVVDQLRCKEAKARDNTIHPFSLGKR